MMHIIVENECLDSLARVREYITDPETGSSNEASSSGLDRSKGTPEPQRKPPAPPARSADNIEYSPEDAYETKLGEMILNFDILKAVIALEPRLLTAYSQALFPDWWRKADGTSVKGGSQRRSTLKASSTVPGNVKRVRFADEEPSASTSTPPTSFGE